MRLARQVYPRLLPWYSQHSFLPILLLTSGLPMRAHQLCPLAVVLLAVVEAAALVAAALAAPASGSSLAQDLQGMKERPVSKVITLTVDGHNYEVTVIRMT